MASRWSRREVLSRGASCGLALLVGRSAGEEWLAALGQSQAPAVASPLATLLENAPAARFWVSTASAARRGECLSCHQPAELPADWTPGSVYDHAEPTVRCQLCAQGCRLDDGERGRCRARLNVGGELKSLVYGRPISVHVDPIEKKPFYHFLPGTDAFSMATAGCPLSCKFCQNWEISQASPEDFDSAYVAPERVVAAAVRRGAPIIAFTYNEPTVFTEYLVDIARRARPQQRRSVLVSCGFMTEEPLAEMCEVLDAIKIDLKGFSEAFYRQVCGAELQPVLRSIKQVAATGVHLEIVNLVVPTLNDSRPMVTELSKWLVGEVGPEVPLHFTRFHPDYQMPNLPPTPIDTLEKARDIARGEGMRYVYVGNVPGHPGNHTYCPKCGERVIERRGFFVVEVRLRAGRCSSCGTAIAGVWS